MKTIVVIQDSRPGLLAKITTLLAEHEISLNDVSGQTLGNSSVITLQVEPYDDAMRLLSEVGYHVYASETLLFRLEHRAGALARVSRDLADAGVNVRGLHIVNKQDDTAIVALETLQQDEARQVLKDLLV